MPIARGPPGLEPKQASAKGVGEMCEDHILVNAQLMVPLSPAPERSNVNAISSTKFAPAPLALAVRRQFGKEPSHGKVTQW